jgi:aminopeptidase N
MEFRKRIESSYGDRRRADAERPLVRIDGSKAGDTTVTYDKGGWVFWMLTDLIGREAAFAGFHELIEVHKDGPDFAVLQDVVASLRPHAADPAAFDAFVDQWFYQVVVPEYRFSDVVTTEVEGGWDVRATVHNDGTGMMPLEVAVTSGDRMDDEGEPLPEYHDARVTVTLGPGESQEVIIHTDFEPDQLLPDPDVRVLQLERARAMRRL